MLLEAGAILALASNVGLAIPAPVARLALNPRLIPYPPYIRDALYRKVNKMQMLSSTARVSRHDRTNDQYTRENPSNEEHLALYQNNVQIEVQV